MCLLAVVAYFRQPLNEKYLLVLVSIMSRYGVGAVVLLSSLLLQATVTAACGTGRPHPKAAQPKPRQPPTWFRLQLRRPSRARHSHLFSTSDAGSHQCGPDVWPGCVRDAG